MSFSISRKPITTLDLSSGQLFLYSLRESDLVVLSRLPKSSPPRQKLLTSISRLASRMEYDKDTQPKPVRLSPTEVEALPEADMSQIAQVLLEPSYFNRLWSVNRDALVERPPDVTTNSYDERVARVVDWLVADRANQEKKRRELLDRSSYGPLHDWIKQAQRLQKPLGVDIEAMRRAIGDIDTSALAEVKRNLGAHEELRKSLGDIDMGTIAGSKRIFDAQEELRKLSSFDALRSPELGSQTNNFSDPPQPFVDPLADFHRMVREERQRELAHAHTMADAAVTSTRIMKKLSDDFLGFMERFTIAAGSSEMSQRKSLKYAILTFGGGAFIALLAFMVTWMSYWQDKNNNRNNDAWQERVEALVKQRASSDVEVEELRRQNRSLSTRVEALEVKSREGVKSKLGAH